MARLDLVPKHCDNALPAAGKDATCKGQARVTVTTDCRVFYEGKQREARELIGTYCVSCGHKVQAHVNAAERLNADG